MEPVERRRWTEEEYLAAEHRSGVRHELVNGEIVAMAGGSFRHNAIAGNLIGALRARLRAAGRRCQVLPSDQRVHVAATGLYTYPDVTVICGPPRFHDKDPQTLVNPLVLVEVLSESTADYDRGAKLAHYRRIPSLQEVLLVSQDAIRIEHYRRLDPRRWELTEYEDGAVTIPALSIDLPLEEIYDVEPEVAPVT